jgi:hypothetical protein
MEISHVFADSRWAILPPRLLAAAGILAFLTGFLLLFKNFPEAFQ